MQSLTRGLSRVHLALVALFSVAFVTMFVSARGAHAAADATTGIDYKTDVADPVIAAGKPAILAGLAVMVLLLAVTLGRKLWSKVSKTG